ncbi:DUF4105 domain-containing protein, partial [bacterium]|nr:DUF4105 domain-containing protein [bacterium]
MKRTGPLLKTWRGSVLVLFFFPLVALAGPSSREPLFSPDELLEISHHPQWHALLHYEPHLFGGVKSRIDDPNFFLAPTGQEDPAAELEATLELFFGIGSSPPEKVEGEIAPRCRFVARYHWLRSLLGEERYGEEEGLPCHRFREWRDAIAPWGVTMVFPSAFVNSPASAFGHTLLRIDAKDQSESSRLLAYTASYAAATGGEDPI